MTETTGAGTVLSPEEHDRSGKAGSCGRAWPGLKIVVIDGAGYELPPGEHGELVIAGETVRKGSWRQPQATAAALRPTGLLPGHGRSAEHTSEIQSLMRHPYAVFCLKKTTTRN